MGMLDSLMLVKRQTPAHQMVHQAAPQHHGPVVRQMPRPAPHHAGLGARGKLYPHRMRYDPLEPQSTTPFIQPPWITPGVLGSRAGLMGLGADASAATDTAGALTALQAFSNTAKNISTQWTGKAPPPVAAPKPQSSNTLLYAGLGAGALGLLWYFKFRKGGKRRR